MAESYLRKKSVQCTHKERVNQPHQPMKKFQLIMIGNLTGNGINFGIFDSRESAMEKANSIDSDLYSSPFVKEVIVLQ
jgi:hypothetical protein